MIALRGKRALVTGGSRGIGRMIAEGGTEPGVVMAEIDPAEIATARSRIPSPRATSLSRRFCSARRDCLAFSGSISSRRERANLP